MLIETYEQFGHPATLVKEFRHRVVLCRKAQVTLGSLILITKDNATAFSELSDESFAELPIAIRAIEKALKRSFGYEKINYFMLMMADPEVHFHVIPRYSHDVEFGGLVFKDGWVLFYKSEQVYAQKYIPISAKLKVELNYQLSLK